MLHVAGIAPRVPNISPARISVSRPSSTLKVADCARFTSSIVFWRSPEESLMPTICGCSASFATVSGSMLRPAHVAGLL